MSSATITNYPEIRQETLIPINDVNHHLPGGPVNPSTVQRWLRRGVAGHVLESFLVGTKRFTSVEAIERFLIRANGYDPAVQAEPRSTMAKRDLEAARKKYNLPPAGKNGRACND